MKSDLDLLIEQCEAEKQLLEQLIKESLEEHDYLSAHYHSVALELVNSQTRLLYNFNDPLYNEKQHFESIKRMLLRNKTADISDYAKKVIEEEEIKLQLLAQQKNGWFNDDQKVDDALFDLYDRKFNSFKIRFNQDDKFYLNFELSADHVLEISIPLPATLNNNYAFNEEHINLLQALGFKLNATGDHYVYQYNMANFKGATAIKTLLSRIIYNVFHWENGTATAILIHNNTS